MNNKNELIGITLTLDKKFFEQTKRVFKLNKNKKPYVKLNSKKRQIVIDFVEMELDNSNMIYR
jgi:hypothetical protein